jgi:hypothetical protein
MGKYDNSNEIDKALSYYPDGKPVATEESKADDNQKA